MKILDLKKELKQFYAPTAKEVVVVDVPAMQFVMLDGAIEPDHRPGDSPSFAEAMQAMYGAAYTLKFMSKKRKEDPIDYPVMAMEGLWWTENGEYDLANPRDWQYTLMVMQPAHITAEMFNQALAQLRKKRPSPAIEKLRLAEFAEGRCIQVMHLGPYSEEMVTIQRMDDYAAAHGLSMHGKHHEIYLGDPRRGDPANLKTILRHPVK
jgi:hypothetical protein